MAFKKLLERKDPTALEVHSSFSASKDFTAFNAGVIRAVRGSTAIQKNNTVQKNISNSNSKDTVRVPLVTATSGTAQVCRHMQKTGICRNGSACKFSHDLAARTDSNSKAGKNPTNNNNSNRNNNRIAPKGRDRSQEVPASSVQGEKQDQEAVDAAASAPAPLVKIELKPTAAASESGTTSTDDEAGEKGTVYSLLFFDLILIYYFSPQLHLDFWVCLECAAAPSPPRLPARWAAAAHSRWRCVTSICIRPAIATIAMIVIVITIIAMAL